jgi:hypothetical protein
MQSRFDKQGNVLPDTGRGCGCQQCADANAPRYERRAEPERISRWNGIHRRLARLWRNKKGLAAITARPSAD